MRAGIDSGPGLVLLTDGLDDIESETGVESFDDTGAVPQRPLTHPPMRRLRLGVFRKFAALDSVLRLSVEGTVAVSERFLPAATDARSDFDDLSTAFGGSGPAVIVVVEVIAGVENSSKLGETMRRGIRSVECRLPSRDVLGV